MGGVANQGVVGFLSLFEHYGSHQVGNNLKNPEYPIWVVVSESHYTVLFSTDRDLLTRWQSQDRFDLFYFDQLAKQDEEIRLTVDTLSDQGVPDENKDLVPPLEHVIRTHWPDAAIEWNGSEPLL